jgi:hypothetical protein
MELHYSATKDGDAALGDLDYRAILATIAAAQAGTPTARAAAAIARPPAPPVAPITALVDLMRPSSGRTDPRALNGSFHPATADRIGAQEAERSVKGALTFAFEGSFKGADVGERASERAPASVRQ